MNIYLDQIINLVGKLDDSPGDDTPSKRFRRFLSENINDAGRVRDYVEDCLRKTGDQYNRALQDLVNYTGTLLGFDVTYGRYHGVVGQIRFDGHWKSPTGFHLVIEVKTTEAYAIKAATLVGYVDRLISDKVVPDWENAMGLYVVGRPDPEVHQLENAVIAEKRTGQLRIISAESLLSLAEMMCEYDVSHADILSLLRPSGPGIDPLVNLIAGLVAEEKEVDAEQEQKGPKTESPHAGPEDDTANYWLTPVQSDEHETAEEEIERLVGKEGIYAYGKRTPGRKLLKPGDRICFYASATGVVGHATVCTRPEEKRHPEVKDPEKYSWVFGLDNATLYLKEPVVLDAPLRAKLDAFRDRDQNKGWAWFVQASRRITRDDFELLTRH